MKPSLETVTELYKVAHQMKAEATFALDRIRDSLTRHGFTEEQVREAAGIYPAKVDRVKEGA